MRVAMHQPHYFPWLGYFDIIAKADLFILMDEVQLERRSYMIRNRILDRNGEIKYLTISGDTKDFLNKEYREITAKDNAVWTAKQMNILKEYYRFAAHKDEMLPIIEAFLKKDYQTVCEWTCGSIVLIKDLLQVKTPMVYQSELEYDRTSKKSDLVLALCKAVNADVSFTGRGASMPTVLLPNFRTLPILFILNAIPRSLSPVFPFWICSSTAALRRPAASSGTTFAPPTNLTKSRHKLCNSWT